jgi:hypothetical protein
MILAEGLGQDSRGAITVIGVNQNVFETPSLPGITKRAVLVHLVDDDRDPKIGDQLNFRVRVVSPSEEVINAQGAQVAVGPPRWPNLPLSIDFPIEIVMNCPEYGPYRIELDAQFPEGVTFKGSVILYVMEPSIAESKSRLGALGVSATQ